MVSVLIKVPFSASLLTGSPPPHTLKYSQLSRHIATPAATSSSILAKFARRGISTSLSRLTFPNRKSPYCAFFSPSNSGENVDMFPAQSMLVIAKGSTSWLLNVASLGRITC